MVFLIPLILIIGVIFVFDYYFYAEEDAAASAQHRAPDDAMQKKQERAKKYIQAMILDEAMKNDAAGQ